MRNPTLLLVLAASVLLTACSAHKKPAVTNPPAPTTTDATLPPPPPTPPGPPPAAAVAAFRADGDLPARHQRIVDEARKGGCEIAFIGDSITEGWAGAGKGEWDKTWAPRHAINCGIGGDRTQHVLGRLDHDLMDALAAPNNSIKWVVLMIGTNNTGADSAEDIAAGIHAIVARVHHGLPSARIVLVSVFPRGQWPNPQRDTINAVNARIAGLVDGQHVIGLDIGPKFLKPSGELPGDLMPDYLHLSPAGYAIWSESLEKALQS